MKDLGSRDDGGPDLGDDQADDQADEGAELAVSLAPELLTPSEAVAEAVERELALAARVRLVLEVIAACRSAQAPAEDEGQPDRIDAAAVGRTIRRYCGVLDTLAAHLEHWG